MILPFAIEAAGRQRTTVRDRLRDELLTVQDYLAEAVAAGLGDDSVGFYRDTATALRELIADRSGAAA